MAGQRPTGTATRAAIVVTAVAVVMNMVLDVGPSGFYATFGVFILLVLSDFQGPLRTRFWAYILTGAAGLLLIGLGALVQPYLWAKLAVTLLVVFALAYLTLLRGYVRSAYLSLLLPFIVAVTTAAELKDLPTGLACYAAGAVVAGVTAVVLWPNRESQVIQHAVAKTLTASARMIAGSPPMAPDAQPAQVDALMAEVTAAEAELARVFRGKLARPGNLTAQERGLVQLVDDAARLRFAIRWPGDKAITLTAIDLDLMHAAHDALLACADVLTNGDSLPDDISETLRRVRLEHVQKYPETADRLVADGKVSELVATANASFYARLTSFLSAMVVRHTRFAVGQVGSTWPGRHRPDQSSERSVTDIAKIEGASAPAALLRSNLVPTSPWFRRAVQIALAVTIAVLIIDLMHLQTGFWVILGIAASLQLNAGGSRRSALWVAIGTTAGFGICLGLVALIGTNMIALICLLPFVSFLTVWGPSGRFAVAAKQAGFTVWFVMLVSLAGHDMSAQVGNRRMIDVGIGLAVSLLITAVLWPRGVADRVRDVLDDSVRSTADYFTAAVTYITSPMTPADTATIDRAARSAEVARDRGTDAFDVALSEGGADAQDAAAWETVFNAVDHAFFAATMVRELEDYGLAPLPDAKVRTGLRTASARVAEQFENAIDTVHDQLLHTGAAPRTTGRIDAADGQTSVIEQTIAGWDGHSGALAYSIDGTAFTTSYGRAAVSLLWTQDWLLYFQWMAGHSGAAEHSASRGDMPSAPAH